MSQIEVKDARLEAIPAVVDWESVCIDELFAVGSDRSVLRKLNADYCEWLLDRTGVPAEGTRVVPRSVFTRFYPRPDLKLVMSLQTKCPPHTNKVRIETK